VVVVVILLYIFNQRVSFYCPRWKHKKRLSKIVIQKEGWGKFSPSLFFCPKGHWDFLLNIFYVFGEWVSWKTSWDNWTIADFCSLDTKKTQPHSRFKMTKKLWKPTHKFTTNRVLTSLRKRERLGGWRESVQIEIILMRKLSELILNKRQHQIFRENQTNEKSKRRNCYYLYRVLVNTVQHHNSFFLTFYETI